MISDVCSKESGLEFESYTVHGLIEANVLCKTASDISGPTPARASERSRYGARPRPTNPDPSQQAQDTSLIYVSPPGSLGCFSSLFSGR
jgi:hypothetical protein